MTRRLWPLFLFLLPSPLKARVYESFADIAERAIPGVVNIHAAGVTGSRESLLDPYEFFLKGPSTRNNDNVSRGSGVLIDERGYIVTNRHVIQDATSIYVQAANSPTKILATIVGSDRKTDLALLKIPARHGLKPLELASSDTLRVGDVVLAIGNPFGYSHTVTSGIISAKGRVIGQGPYDNFLQTDASIHAGNSGGPLIDIRGRVIGINAAVHAEAKGIGFAIPASLVKETIKDLMAHGKVIRPWLGIVGKNMRGDLGDSEVKLATGVVIENLVIDSPAFKANLQIGDLLLAIGNERVQDLNQAQRVLMKRMPKDQVKLKVYRRGKGQLIMPVALTEIPPNEDLPDEKDLF